MVYDVTSEESFNHINDWFTEVNRYASENTCKLLVGNKTDKVSDKVIPTEKAKAYADKLNIPFIETSAVDATNVETAFITITKDLISTRGLAPASSTAEKSSTIKNLNQSEGGSAKKSACC
eukprot:gene22223-28337_t